MKKKTIYIFALCTPDGHFQQNYVVNSDTLFEIDRKAKTFTVGHNIQQKYHYLEFHHLTVPQNTFIHSSRKKD